MNVKSVPIIQPYQVNNANDTNDEEKGHGSKGQDRRRKKAPAPAQTPAANQPVEVSPDSNADFCQIVDSEKVLQLLAQKPSDHANVFRTFNDHKPQAAKSVINPAPIKKLNRKL